MSIKGETEADTRANRIDPVLREAGWGVVEGSKIRREMICPGRITGGGGRANPLSADYVLSYRDRKLAVIEAKRAGLGHTSGVGQAKDVERQPPCPVPTASLAGAVTVAAAVRSAQSAPFWSAARLSAEVVGATTASSWRRAAARRR